jgi:hypothetical protein
MAQTELFTLGTGRSIVWAILAKLIVASRYQRTECFGGRYSASSGRLLRSRLFNG